MSILYHTYEVMMLAKDKDLKKIVVRLESSWKSVLYYWSDVFDDWKKLKHIMRMSFSSWKYLYWKSILYHTYMKWWCLQRIKIWRKSLSSWNHPDSLFYTIEVMMSRCLMTARKHNRNVILKLLKVYILYHTYIKWWCLLKVKISRKSLSSWNQPESQFYTIDVMMPSCMMTERKPNGNVILQLEISLLKVNSIPYLWSDDACKG